MSTASTLQAYQPLVVGLGAVVLATFGNTLLEWFRRSLHDRREAKTIRTAFAAELRIHQEMYRGAMTSEQKEEKEGHFLVPIDPFMPAYDNLIGKIGLLGPEEAAAVLKAYSNIILIPKSFLVMGRIHKGEFASYAEIPVHYASVLNEMNETMINVIGEALVVLEKR